jgi:hypothetical protein
MQLVAAAGAQFGWGARAQVSAAPPYIIPKSTVNRKNVVAIQVKPFAWRDEGIDQVLDILQEKGDVNTVFVYTYDSDPGRISKSGNIPLPGHGSYGTGAPRTGGAYYDYDQKYFRNTFLKDFRSQDEGNFNVITAVAPKMKARGMDFFAWDYNNTFPVTMRSIPGFTEVAEVDVYGRRTNSACFNHPDYRANLTGKIESYLSGYPDEVKGIAWGCERMGPLDNMIGGDWATIGISCFCNFCQEKGRAQGISVRRAKSGFIALDQLFQAGDQSPRPIDGYFVTFWRILLQYPEILSWQNLWTQSFHEVRSELYGTAKSLSPEKPFGFHIMQNVTFSPFYSAEEDYAETRRYADFLKIATYNNAAGPRMAHFMERLCATVFRDATPQELQPLLYKMMNYEERPYDQIGLSGLSADYVSRETKRAIAGTGGGVQIYSGIDIDVPTKLTGEKRTSPGDVKAAIRAAMSAGAHGVVLSRD